MEQMPFLSTTQILIEAVKRGIGRERAHEVIKKYSLKALLAIKEGGDNSFLEDLSNDELFLKVGIDKKLLLSIMKDKKRFMGNSKIQIERVLAKSRSLLERYRKEASYEGIDVI
jgi:adenylosuccinate lyase